MTVDENKFRQIVIEALHISADKYRPDLRLGDIDEWDSVAHFDLVSSLEQAFGLRLSADEIVDLTGLTELRARIAQPATP